MSHRQEIGASDVHPRHQCRVPRLGGLPRRGRPVIAAAEEERFTHDQARQAAGSVLDLGAALSRHRLLPDARRRSSSPTSTMSPTRSTRPLRAASVASIGDVHPAAPAERPPGPAEWEAAWDPAVRRLDGQRAAPSRRRRTASPRGPLPGRARGRSLSAGISSSTTSRHAASAFLASPFERAAVLTLDGRGEKATTGYCHGPRQSTCERLGEVHMPHSLGILYEQVTEYLGFLHSSDEYKVMALASYGEPRYVDDVPRHRPPGAGTAPTRSSRPASSSGSAPPAPGADRWTQHHFDIAHSLQVVLEETVLDLARWLHATTGERRSLPGRGRGAQLRDERPHPRRGPVRPHLGAAGRRRRRHGARRGAVDRRQRARRHRAAVPDGPCLPRPGYADAEIEAFLRWSKLPYRRLDDVAEETATLLAAGPRHRLVPGADGVRPQGARGAIDPGLADPRRDAGPAQRDQGPRGLPAGRAGGPRGEGRRVVRRRTASRRSCCSSTTCGPSKADRIPAVRHVDGTARIQTINRAQNPLYYDLIAAFARQTGVPVLVNTSFNTRGEPIVCTPARRGRVLLDLAARRARDRPLLLEKPGVPAVTVEVSVVVPTYRGRSCSIAAWRLCVAQDLRPSRLRDRHRRRRGQREHPPPGRRMAKPVLADRTCHSLPAGVRLARPAAARNAGWRFARGE